jgi:hypothetical protein
MTGGLGTVVIFCFAVALGILAIIFLVVPLFKGIGWMIGGFFRGIGWLVKHVFEFVAGMIGDTVRFLGAGIAWLVLLPLVVLNIVIGRWSASGHFLRSMKRECGVAGSCLYRVVLQRPLRFLLLGGLLEGLEERVNEAVVAAPAGDKPGPRTGSFDGYAIVGSLPEGGSGAKLYIAEPDERRRAKHRGMPGRVVIKSFALTDGSSLPQIVRESRALEAARQMGLVLDHGMDERRFYYVMPYHHGDSLGFVSRQLHGASDAQGLGRAQLPVALGYVRDLLQTLCRYHEGGLWHKDVKPDNIIVHDGRAHLVDLGLVTPLRSAMTLTTHGTEYFRDPEMVRMALRGVKVHQVDGAKFDVYAAGAVLYFLIENTFPAHGGLSTFAKRSPESARWIIRRAMADYHKRYETAAQMLADVHYVASAPDPGAVRPADLPSMRGAPAPEPEPAEPRFDPDGERPFPKTRTWTAGPVFVEVQAAAGSPRPPRPEAPAPAAAPMPGAADPAVPAPRPRPAIRVTNWWTGAYEVVDPGLLQAGAAEGAAFRADARQFRAHVQGMRTRAEAARAQLRLHGGNARRAAREQIREARARARDMQSRARHHRLAAAAVPAGRQPHGALALVPVALIAGLVLVIWSVKREDRAGRLEHQRVLAMSVPEVAMADLAGPMRLLLLNDHPAASNALVRAQVEAMVREQRGKGWEIIEDEPDAEVELRKVLPPAGPDPAAPLSPLVRKALAEHGCSGFIMIRSLPAAGRAPAGLRFQSFFMPAELDEPVRVEELAPAPAE